MSAYYNEHDPKAAAWLRELIKDGLIAPGDVDERSITDISPHELTGYTQQHFFAGIGGWSYALRLAGWPDDKPVRTGSCPCQPFSQAGKGLGMADERHLWPVFRDLITFGEPTITFGEQVASKAGRDWLAGVRADLEGLGYAVGAADLCAAGVGAPHIRQRLYWVADANRRRLGKHEERHGHAAQPGFKAPCWNDSLRCGGVGGLAYAANQRGAQQLDESRKGSRRGPSTTDSAKRTGPCGLGDADVPGRREQCGPVAVQSEQPSAELRGNLGYWSAFDRLPCTDGKTRRIEPGSFPLAHGVSGRVGLLRGYGNAIVSQVAAEFIEAVMEAIS